VNLNDSNIKNYIVEGKEMTLTKSHPRVLLTLILIGVLTITIASTSFFTKPVTADSGESWLSGWQYRKSHVITHASGAEENYQVRITTYYTVPIQNTKFGHFTKYGSTPLDVPLLGASGVVHPDVLYFPSAMGGYTYWMAYTPDPPTNLEHPCIARSNDGITWTTTDITNPVVSLAPSDADPAIVYVSSLGKWFMVWSAYYSPITKIGLAYSTDGKTWTQYNGISVNGNPSPFILSGDDNGKQAWEYDAQGSKVTEPNLLYEDGTFYMHYATYVGGNNRGKAGLATFTWDNTGNNVQDFQRNTNNPLVDLPADSIFASGCGHIDVSKYGSTYYMYVVRVTLGGNMELALLTSPDKTSWAYQGRVMQTGPLGAWDDQYIYRSCPVTDAVGNMVDFSGNIKLYYSGWHSDIPHIGLATGSDVGTGTDNGEVCYLNGRCRTDFGDVRFTRSDGITLLNYWMETKVDGDHATFWAKIPDNLSTADQTIYVYYGRSDATTTSDIKAASLGGNGDDFNDNSRDPTLWDAWSWGPSGYTGAATETNQHLQLAINQAKTTVGFVSHNPISANNFEMSILAHNPTIGEVAFYLHDTHVTTGLGPTNYDCLDICDTTNQRSCYRIMLYRDNSACWVQKKILGVYTALYHGGTWLSSENTIKIRVEDGTIKFFEGDTLRASDTYSLPTRNPYIIIEGWGQSNIGTDWADNFWIRRYVSPEPGHGAWGIEEKKSTTITVGCNPTTVLKTGTQVTTISGQLVSLGSGVPDKAVNLYYQAGATGPNQPPTDGTWILLIQTSTGGGGGYSFAWDPPDTLPNGYYWIKASFEGDLDYGPSSATTGVDMVSNLFVIPEYALGTILALGVCFGGVIVYKKYKNNKFKPT
jgi:predicted GH43/DUF377 family glycosyl hydrolase